MGMRSWATGQRRAQSSTVGLVLVFGLVILATTTTVVIGSVAIEDTRNQLNSENTENTMTQLDSQAALVGFGDSNNQQVAIDSSDESVYRIDESAGKLTVTHETDAGDDVIVDEELGAVIHEVDDGKIVAYQGGGVWRSDGGGGAVMVSPPNFHYRDATLTLPIVTVAGDGTIDGRATLSSGDTVQNYPDKTNGDVNPLEAGLITVSVQSEYYRAWGSYFEERTDGTVNYDDGTNTTTLELTVPTEGKKVNGAIISGGVASELQVKNSAVIDSYDSSNGDYGSTEAEGGDVYTAGELIMKSDSELEGSLVIEEHLEMDSGARITGDLNYGSTRDLENSEDTHIDGDVESTADVPETSAVDGLIDEKRTDFASDNDNSDHSSDINALENANDCDPCTLTAGRYHLDELDLRNSGGDAQLNLEPNGDTIQVAVDGDFLTAQGSNIEVIGDGRVEFYVERSVDLDQDTRVTNNGDDAPQFWIYQNQDETFRLRQDGEYTGVIYGPGSSNTEGVRIRLDQDTQLFGAMVGNADDLDNDQDVHYDSALGSSSVVDEDTKRPALTYLHISTNEVKIEDG